MKRLIPLYTLIWLLVSCSGKKTSPMNPQVEQDFKRYLTEKELIAPEKHLFVLLHPGYCGSCTEEIQAFVKTELEGCTLPKTLIFSSDKEDVTTKFSSIAGLRIVKDAENQLQKYGLANGVEIYLVQEGSKTIAFGPINTETIGPELQLCVD